MVLVRHSSEQEALYTRPAYIRIGSDEQADYSCASGRASAVRLVAPTTQEGCRRLALEKARLFAMWAGVGLLTVMGQNRSGALSLLNAALRLRIENAIVNTMTYLQKMLWPVNLTAFYPKNLR